MPKTFNPEEIGKVYNTVTLQNFSAFREAILSILFQNTHTRWQHSITLRAYDGRTTYTVMLRPVSSVFHMCRTLSWHCGRDRARHTESEREI